MKTRTFFGLSSVTESTSSSRSTQDFLKSSSHMFSYVDGMLKTFNCEIYNHWNINNEIMMGDWGHPTLTLSYPGF